MRSFPQDAGRGRSTVTPYDMAKTIECTKCGYEFEPTRWHRRNDIWLCETCYDKKKSGKLSSLQKEPVMSKPESDLALALVRLAKSIVKEDPENLSLGKAYLMAPLKWINYRSNKPAGIYNRYPEANGLAIYMGTKTIGGKLIHVFELPTSYLKDKNALKKPANSIRDFISPPASKIKTLKPVNKNLSSDEKQDAKEAIQGCWMTASGQQAFGGDPDYQHTDKQLVSFSFAYDLVNDFLFDMSSTNHFSPVIADKIILMSEAEEKALFRKALSDKFLAYNAREIKKELDQAENWQDNY